MHASRTTHAAHRFRHPVQGSRVLRVCVALDAIENDFTLGEFTQLETEMHRTQQPPAEIIDAVSDHC
jgi:hypothetical protein